MIIVFHSDRLKGINTVEDPMFTELVHITQAEALNHFGEGSFKCDFFYDDTLGGYVEVEIPVKKYFNDIELSKEHMYKDQADDYRYMTDFVSEVEENLSWGGLQVFCKD